MSRWNLNAAEFIPDSFARISLPPEKTSWPAKRSLFTSTFTVTTLNFWEAIQWYACLRAHSFFSSRNSANFTNFVWWPRIYVLLIKDRSNNFMEIRDANVTVSLCRTTKIIRVSGVFEQTKDWDLVGKLLYRSINNTIIIWISITLEYPRICSPLFYSTETCTSQNLS